MDGHESLQERAIEYPVRDGRPMAESDAHANELRDYAVDVLRDHFEREPLTYVSGNNFIYYTEGVPADVVSPDCYVVKGIAMRQRDTLKLWEEGGRSPCFALEITSKSTRREDLGDKMAKYRDDLQVAEYFLFDLRGDWIKEHLRGYRLAEGVYQPIERSAAGRLPSRELGLELGMEGGHIRFFPPGAAEPLPTRKEQVKRLQAELARGRAPAPKAKRPPTAPRRKKPRPSR